MRDERYVSASSSGSIVTATAGMPHAINPALSLYASGSVSHLREAERRSRFSARSSRAAKRIRNTEYRNRTAPHTVEHVHVVVCDTEPFKKGSERKCALTSDAAGRELFAVRKEQTDVVKIDAALQARCPIHERKIRCAVVVRSGTSESTVVVRDHRFDSELRIILRRREFYIYVIFPRDGHHDAFNAALCKVGADKRASIAAVRDIVGKSCGKEIHKTSIA